MHKTYFLIICSKQFQIIKFIVGKKHLCLCIDYFHITPPPSYFRNIFILCLSFANFLINSKSMNFIGSNKKQL